MKKANIFETISAHITIALPLCLLKQNRTNGSVALIMEHTHLEFKEPRTIERYLYLLLQDMDLSSLLDDEQFHISSGLAKGPRQREPPQRRLIPPKRSVVGSTRSGERLVINNNKMFDCLLRSLFSLKRKN